MMKVLKTMIPALALMLLACNKIDTEIDKDSPAYVGTMTVTDGEPFVSENVRVVVEVSGNLLDMKLEKVKFVPAMPVRIDVTVLDIPAERAEDGTVTFSGTDIIPYALGKQYPKFKVTGLKGTITPSGELSFSLKFGEYPTEFEGVYRD